MRTQSTMGRAPAREAGREHVHYTSIPITRGQVILDGFGIRLSIRRGQLRLEDGLGDTRRSALLTRATCGLKRIAIIGHTGTISLEVLRWLADVRASISVIDKDGALLLVHGPSGRDDARLRRAQAVAPWTGQAMTLARELIREKLQSQARLLEQMPDTDDAIGAIRVRLEAVDGATSPEQLRAVEARAAAAYWAAWATMPVRFGNPEAVPEHWRTFGARNSPLTGAARGAITPANALLNYLYAVLEAEASIAIRAMGLDPGMGLLHVDQLYRDSLAFDVMEPVRANVDAYVLELVQSHTFSPKDFHETRTGICRLLPPLTRRVAGTAALWATALAPIVERIAHAINDTTLPAWADTADSLAHARAGIRPQHRDTPPHKRLPTPLTQSNRSAGRAAMRQKRSSPSSIPMPRPPAPCTTCGVLLASSSQTYCDACLAAQRNAIFTEARRLDDGTTAHGDEAGRTRGQRDARHVPAVAEWEHVNGPTSAYDAAIFRERVVPGLQGKSVHAISRAVGLSLYSSVKVQRGTLVPHPCHWGALAQLAGVAWSPHESKVHVENTLSEEK